LHLAQVQLSVPRSGTGGGDTAENILAFSAALKVLDLLLMF
jgi:hypothetical protein